MTSIINIVIILSMILMFIMTTASILMVLAKLVCKVVGCNSGSSETSAYVKSTGPTPKVDTSDYNLISEEYRRTLEEEEQDDWH